MRRYQVASESSCVFSDFSTRPAILLANNRNRVRVKRGQFFPDDGRLLLQRTFQIFPNNDRTMQTYGENVCDQPTSDRIDQRSDSESISSVLC